MANNLSVSICRNVKKGLDVNDHTRQNEVLRKTEVTLTWKLIGDAAKQGEFRDPDGPTPGFQWISDAHYSPPPDGIFGRTVRSGNGLSMSMSVEHSGLSTVGEWAYILRVEMPDGTYTTSPSPPPDKTPNNPTIINK